MEKIDLTDNIANVRGCEGKGLSGYFSLLQERP